MTTMTLFFGWHLSKERSYLILLSPSPGLCDGPSTRSRLREGGSTAAASPLCSRRRPGGTRVAGHRPTVGRAGRRRRETSVDSFSPTVQ